MTNFWTAQTWSLGCAVFALQVERDYAAGDSAQLTVKEGELVYIKQKDPSGTDLLRDLDWSEGGRLFNFIKAFTILSEVWLDLGCQG